MTQESENSKLSRSVTVQRTRDYVGRENRSIPVPDIPADFSEEMKRIVEAAYRRDLESGSS